MKADSMQVMGRIQIEFPKKFSTLFLDIFTVYKNSEECITLVPVAGILSPTLISPKDFGFTATMTPQGELLIEPSTLLNGSVVHFINLATERETRSQQSQKEESP